MKVTEAFEKLKAATRGGYCVLQLEIRESQSDGRHVTWRAWDGQGYVSDVSLDRLVETMTGEGADTIREASEAVGELATAAPTVDPLIRRLREAERQGQGVSP